MNTIDFMTGNNTNTSNGLDIYVKIEGLDSTTVPVCKNDCLNFFGIKPIK